MSSTAPTVASESAVRHRADAIEELPADPPRVQPLQPLRGRNIGILCNDPQRPGVVDLQDIATGMGALVALVRPDFGQVDERTGLEQMARVLGRLYDAVLCFDLPPSVVQQLGEASAVPVIDADGRELRQLTATGAATEEQARLLASRLASLCV